MISRRQWGRGMGAVAFGSTFAWKGGAVARADAEVEAAFRTIDQVSRRLARGEIRALHWQSTTEGTLGTVPASALRAALRLEWADVQAEVRRDGRFSRRLRPDDVRGVPPNPWFRRKLYAFKEGRAIVPHGHRSLASVFVVLDGRFRGRHYDRVRDEAEAVLIRPTGDRTFVAGEAHAISDDRDNVHWFESLDDGAVLFNVSVTARATARDPRVTPSRVHLDPDGEPLEGGLIRAARATVDQLRARYDAP